MSNDTEVMAIYFPSWHANDHYQAWLLRMSVYSRLAGYEDTNDA